MENKTNLTSGTSSQTMEVVSQPIHRSFAVKFCSAALPIVGLFAVAGTNVSCYTKTLNPIEQIKPKNPLEIQDDSLYPIETFNSDKIGTFDFYRDDNGTIIPTDIKLDKIVQNDIFRAKVLEIINEKLPYARYLNGGDEFQSLEEFIDFAVSRHDILGIIPVSLRTIDTGVAGSGYNMKRSGVKSLFDLKFNIANELYYGHLNNYTFLNILYRDNQPVILSRGKANIELLPFASEPGLTGELGSNGEPVFNGFQNEVRMYECFIRPDRVDVMIGDEVIISEEIPNK